VAEPSDELGERVLPERRAAPAQAVEIRAVVVVASSMAQSARPKALVVSLWLAPLAALICTGSSWGHYAATGSVRLDEHPRSAALHWANLGATLGLVLLAVFCVVVYRTVTSKDLPRVLASSTVVHVVMLGALPLTSTDFFTYLAYGELSARGLDPRFHTPKELVGSELLNLTTYHVTPSVYGPVANFMIEIAGQVGSWVESPLWAAGACYKLLTGLVVLAAILVVYRMARASEDDALARGFVVLALNPLLAWEVEGHAHNDGLVILFSALFLWAVWQKRHALGIVSLVLGTLSKFVLAPLIPLQLRVAARSGLARGLALGLLAAAVTAAIYGITWAGPETFASWSRPFKSDLGFGASLHTVLLKAVRVTGASEALQNLVHAGYVWIGRIILLSVGLSLFLRIRTEKELALAAVLLYVTILSTAAVLAPWYFTWLLPFAAAQANRRWQELVLLMTLSAAPGFGIPFLWLTMPIMQVLGLIALFRWARSGAALTPAA
jgi:alpha-1,6-mannosyltransferase